MAQKRPPAYLQSMRDLSVMPRSAGLLLPVFAMRRAGDWGIGDTHAVRDTIDFCADHHFSVLQILPIHETVGDHSPYNPISSQALSPALLTLSPEEVPGLTRPTIERMAPERWLAQLRAGIVKHQSVQPLKLQVLQAAHHTFRQQVTNGDPLARAFAEFQQSAARWLQPYTLFRLLVREYEGNPNWTEWRPEHQSPSTAEAWFAEHPHRDRLAEQREGYAFIQWVATRQWTDVRNHADARGVQLMGEMSFGVSRASVDVWAHPELFDQDWSLGTRPLAFFDSTSESARWGQNWGLPAYRWEDHRSSGFTWLRERVAAERQFFHLCRIDHMRGYFRVYQFPWRGGAQHAEFSQLTVEEVQARTGGRLPRYVPGPDEEPAAAALNDRQGRELLGVIQDAADGMGLIAEIMGKLPEYMSRALEDLRLANLTFPQLELAEDGSIRPAATFPVRSLATYANHDTAPLAALYLHGHAAAQREPEGVAARELANLLQFAGWDAPAPEAFHGELLQALQRALFNTPCVLAVLVSSDLLGLPQRFNLPGSFGRETWCERLALPLRDYRDRPDFGARIKTAAQLIVASGRQSGFVRSRPAPVPMAVSTPSAP